MERREINGVFPPVNCLFVYAEGSRKGISKQAQVEISLLFPLISGWPDPSLLLLPLSVSFLLQSHDCWEGIKKIWPREGVINQLDPDRTRRRAERGRQRSKNTAGKVTSCLA